MSAINRALPEASELRVKDGSGWAKLVPVGGVLGLVGLGASVVLGMADDVAKEQFFHSYLVAFLYFLSLALGCLFFVIIQFATRAGWSVTVRRLAENVAATLPVFALLFLPILWGMNIEIAAKGGGHGEEAAAHAAETPGEGEAAAAEDDGHHAATRYVLYDHWLHPHDDLVRGKTAYLNRGFFQTRALIFFACWIFLALFFRRQSTAQDQSGDIEHTRKMQALSYPAIAIFGLTLTFAAVDWIMTLDPHWFSTMFGVYYFAGSTVSSFALLSVLALMGMRSNLLGGTVDKEHMHDLGKLTFGFTVFWTYIAFSQYFLIWYANIPEETHWFAMRLAGSWLDVGKLLIACHFVLPFLFLLPRTIKRHPILMLIGAFWMLTIHFVDLHWQIMPLVHSSGFSLNILDITTFLGVGGIFVATFGWFLKKDSVVPLKDPRLHEALTFENF